jgi:hypothetical protein
MPLFSCNFLHQLYLQFCFCSYLWLAVCKGLYPILSWGNFTFQNVTESSLSPTSLNYWEIYIIWHPLNFPISPVACFIVCCVAWVANFQFTEHHAVSSLPLSSDLAVDLGWTVVCRCLFRVLSPSNKYCVLVGADCRNLENCNYGNKTGEFRLECQAWNSISLWG